MATQTPVHMVHFNTQQNHHQLQDGPDVGLVRPAADEDFGSKIVCGFSNVLILKGIMTF